MSKPKFLKHRKTGAIFPYNETLAKRNRNVEPVFETEQVDVKPEPEKKPEPKEPVGGDLDTGENTGEGLMIGDTALADATKAQMIEFAQNAFGEKLSERSNADSLREQVAALMANA